VVPLKISELNKIIVENVQWFVETSGLKMTSAEFKRNLSHMRQIFDAGFTEEEYKSVVNYLLIHPPKSGSLTSLGYLLYCMNQILDKIKSEEIRSHQFVVPELDIKEEVSNAEKYKQNNNVKIKGTGKF
jgi:hypothetical protein